VKQHRHNTRTKEKEFSLTSYMENSLIAHT